MTMLRELPPDLAKIARDELNEKPKCTKDDVKHLKDWIAKQPHLRARTDDQWLVAMLRGCKFSLERVKKKLDLYYTLRTIAPEVTLRLVPTDPKFVEFFRLGSCLILPKPKNKLFPRVILIRAGVYDPEKNSVADIMCVLYYLVQIAIIDDDVASVLGTKIMVDYRGVSMNHFVQATPTLLKQMVAVCQIAIIDDDVASVLGTKIMVDYRGVSMNHFVQATPTLLKQMVAVCQDSMPLRLKGSHHTNLPAGIEKIFTLISGFLNDKAKQRLKIHKNADDLMEHIPKEIVPAEYGGKGGPVADMIEYWVDKIKEYDDWMRKEVQLGTDESKRPGKPMVKEMAGLDGSFRKLEID